MGWAALMVGIALGLRQLVQQGLGIFGGAIADRFGAKPMIVTGMLLMRAGGFAAMAVAHEPWCSGSHAFCLVSAAPVRPAASGWWSNWCARINVVVSSLS